MRVATEPVAVQLPLKPLRSVIVGAGVLSTKPLANVPKTTVIVFAAASAVVGVKPIVQASVTPMFCVAPANVTALTAGSITYGTGRLLSSRRSASQATPWLRSSDQRVPGGVTDRPEAPKIWTGAT